MVKVHYDAFGRRIQKTVNGTTTKYLYDGINPVQEQTGTATANLLTGLNVDEYFRRTDSQGARDFITDGLGSTLALTDNTGTIQTHYTYDPYGNTTTSGQVSSNPFQYTGRENDGVGLYFYRARYYSPGYQRFISSDPIGLAGGLNTYSYVYNNPTNLIDPYGLWAIGDPLPQGVVDFSAGLGDALLLGFGDDLRDLAGVDGGVNECSSAYQAGGWTSFAFGGARLAYAGLAKGGSILASSGAAASAFRANLKTAFRGGVGRDWRPPNLAGKSDAQLRRSAGKTNFGVNAYGAGVAGAGAAGGSGCGCEN